MIEHRGMLIVLSGPSGSGKGTLVSRILEERDDTVLSVSATTRTPRPGEQDEVHYFFRTKEEFEALIEQGELLEYAQYNGNYYGTLSAPINQWLAEGKNVVLEIEVQGAEKVMNHRSDLVSLFITVPSMEELERRLRNRGTETEESVMARMLVAKLELTRAFRYDYVILNDDLDEAIERINTVIDAENMRYSRMEKYIMDVLGRH